jgi:hypothetical protein
VNYSSFKNHVFGQQGFTGLWRSQQNNVLKVLFIVNFHGHKVLIVRWNADAEGCKSTPGAYNKHFIRDGVRNVYMEGNRNEYTSKSGKAKAKIG